MSTSSSSSSSSSEERAKHRSQSVDDLTTLIERITIATDDKLKSTRHTIGARERNRKHNFRHYRSTTTTTTTAAAADVPVNLSDPAAVNKAYKAAGIVPYCFIDGQMHLLIGMEMRGAEKRYTWSEFGGKRDQKDVDYLDTAIREFSEETVGVFSPLSHEMVQRDSSTTTTTTTTSSTTTDASDTTDATVNKDLDMSVLYRSSCEMLKTHVSRLKVRPGKYGVYVPDGKYLLLLLEMPYVDPAIFRAVSSANSRLTDPSRRIMDSKKVDIAWVHVQEVFDIVFRPPPANDRSKKVDRLCRYAWRETKNGEMEYFHPFFATLMRRANRLITNIQRSKQTASDMGKKSV